MRLGKREITKTATIELGVAAGLAVVGIVLGLLAWRDYDLYGSFSSALRAQAAGRLQDALPTLDAIAQRRADYPFPAELAAKLKVDGGSPTSLKGALALCSWLAESGHGEKPSVKLARAAACIRQGDNETADADRKAAWENAEKALGGLDWPEAKILRGHILLRRGNVTAAAEPLRSAYAEALGGKEVTLDGLIDLYVGLGVCAARTKQPQEAARMFRRAHQLAPRARIPLINTVSALARHFAEDRIPRDDILANNEMLRRRAVSEWRQEFFDRDAGTYKGLDRAIYNYFLGIGWQLVLNRLADPQAASVFYDAGNAFPSLLPPDLARKDLALAAAYLFHAQGSLRDDEKAAYRLRAREAFEQAASKIENPKLKALALNNSGAIGAAFQAGDPNATAPQFAPYRERLEQAAALDPANGVIQRNLGALYYRLGDKAKARAAWEKAVKTLPAAEQAKVRDAIAKAGG